MGFKIGSFHVGQAKSHIAISKCHEELGKLHGLIAESETHKTAQGIRDDCHASIAECHKELCQHHADVAGEHLKAAKALGSGVDTHDDSRGSDVVRAAAGAEPFGMLACRDFKSVRPDGAHLVMPQDGARLIPRHGGAPIDQSEDPTSAIDALAHPGAEIRKAIIGQ